MKGTREAYEELESGLSGSKIGFRIMFVIVVYETNFRAFSENLVTKKKIKDSHHHQTSRNLADFHYTLKMEST